MDNSTLTGYLNGGVAALVKEIARATTHNPKARAYFAGYALAAKKAEKRRNKLEKAGEHVPPFLIASITETCNLQCAGCYDRVNHACKSTAELAREDWRRIFAQAEEMGSAIACTIIPPNPAARPVP